MDTQTNIFCKDCDCKTNLCERCEKEYKTLIEERKKHIIGLTNEYLEEIESRYFWVRKILLNNKFLEEEKDEIDKLINEYERIQKIVFELRDKPSTLEGYKIDKFGFYRKK